VRKIAALLRIVTPGLAAVALLAVSALGAGCSTPSPEERVAELRANYEATLQNFVIREEPLVEPMIGDQDAMDEETVDEETMGEEPAEGEEVIEEVPVRQDVVLDILIRHGNRENLPGLTVEVAQMGEGAADEMSWEEIESSAARKATWRVYLDTSAIGRGQGNSVVHTIEDVDGVDPGDRFVVSVRKPVPPAERSQYREFAEAS
jgi:hypothetical protein